MNDMTEKTREQLVSRLLQDNQNGARQFSILKAFLLWSLGAWAFVILATVWVQALRPGWFAQLFNSPHFAVETISGLVAIILLTLWAFRLSVPASSRRWFLISGILASGVWLSSFAVGLQFPALEASMEGKRELCRYEVLIYAVPLLLLGLHQLNRGYVLNWPLSSLGIGVVSAMVPAWIMQLACMYDPHHILEAHIAPVFVVAIFAGAIGFILQGKKK